MSAPTVNLARLEADLLARGWSRSELARRLDPPVHRSSITRFLDGTVTPTPALLARIAAALRRPASRYVLAAKADAS